MKKYVEFDSNQNGRDFACGDIHGCYDMLMTELGRINFDYETDRLFCVGDLCDRGPDSLKCVGLLDKEWFYCIKGNHEVLFMDCVDYSGYKETIFLHNGGNWIKDLSKDQIDIIYNKFNKLPLAIRVGDVGLIHAEFPIPAKTWSNLVQKLDNLQYQDLMLWGRGNIKTGYEVWLEDIDIVYCGHTIVDEPLTLGSIRYIDTGAFMRYYNPSSSKGRLTIEQFPN